MCNIYCSNVSKSIQKCVDRCTDNFDSATEESLQSDCYYMCGASNGKCQLLEVVKEEEKLVELTESECVEKAKELQSQYQAELTDEQVEKMCDALCSSDRLLSAGATAAIVISVLFVLLIAIIVIKLVCCREKSEESTTNNEQMEDSNQSGEQPPSDSPM